MLFLQGLFEATPIFNILMLVHAILFEVAAWWILYTAGDWWTAWIVSGVFFATSQIQLGWLQHDLVHGTVFSSTRVNRIFNDISLGLMQVGNDYVLLGDGEGAIL